jgi:SlyX protein
MSSAEGLPDRVQQLEMMLMHLQHDVEQLNAVILSQQNEIRALRALVERFEGRLEDAMRDPEVRDLEAEKPPHY